MDKGRSQGDSDERRSSSLDVQTNGLGRPGLVHRSGRVNTKKRDTRKDQLWMRANFSRKIEGKKERGKAIELRNRCLEAVRCLMKLEGAE